jgi:hypothetical protein
MHAQSKTIWFEIFICLSVTHEEEQGTTLQQV